MSLLGLFSRSDRRRHRARRRLAVTVVTLLGLGAMAVGATAYSRLYVFGETLSDVGNLLAAVGITSSPYKSPGFDSSAPPVWTEDIAAHLGLQANSWTSGGSNVDAGNVDGVLPEGFSLPSLAQQIQNYLAGAGTPDPSGLYVVQGGNAATLAAALGTSNVVAGNPGNFTGPTFSSPPSFDAAPALFGFPSNSRVTDPNNPSSDPNCTQNCVEPDPCLEPCTVIACAECFPQPPKDQEFAGCVPGVDCPTGTDLPRNDGCTQNCDDGPPLHVAAIVAAPEPGTAAVILAGLGLLVLVRQRRRMPAPGA